MFPVTILTGGLFRVWCRDFLPGHRVIYISCLKLRSPASEKPSPWQSLTRTIDPLRVLNSLLLRTSPPVSLSSSRCHLSSGSQAGRPAPPSPGAAAFSRLPPLLLSFSQIMSDSCDATDCSLPGSSVHKISQARILESVALSFSRGSS